MACGQGLCINSIIVFCTSGVQITLESLESSYLVISNIYIFYKYLSSYMCTYICHYSYNSYVGLFVCFPKYVKRQCILHKQYFTLLPRVDVYNFTAQVVSSDTQNNGTFYILIAFCFLSAINILLTKFSNVYLDRMVTAYVSLSYIVFRAQQETLS